MQATPQRALSLFDSTCIIVGIIIGAGVYQMAPDIAKGAGSAWGVLVIWVVGGLLSFCGALSYAELASAYPEHTGGDYVYLTRAYGRPAGFLFGWAQLVIIRPGDIAVMAFAFATYGRRMFDPLAAHPQISQRLFAAVAVITLTGINMLGVRQGKGTQNLLTTVKALGLLAIVAVAIAAPPNTTPAHPVEPLPASLALIFVLFAYGGWNEMAYVAAEVQNPRKNIVRALVAGTAAVMLLYLLVNGAFLVTLGYSALAASEAPASDTLAAIFPVVGPRLISTLVCISALGAVNGLIFTGARISYALGSEYRMFRLLGDWNPQRGTPAPALAVQGLIALILILVFGGYIDAVLYTAAAVYAFYLATSLSVIVLRFKEPHLDRPYKVTAYPLTPLIFSLVCAFLIYSSITYALTIKPVSLIILLVALLVGLLIYGFAEKHPHPGR
ncbi:MAG: amino acid permease [Sedimentisphaerales bacterium]|nr:amino acid permease [Sedimentisphaerales bacterium]